MTRCTATGQHRHPQQFPATQRDPSCGKGCSDASLRGNSTHPSLGADGGVGTERQAGVHAQTGQLEPKAASGPENMTVHTRPGPRFWGVSWEAGDAQASPWLPPAPLACREPWGWLPAAWRRWAILHAHTDTAEPGGQVLRTVALREAHAAPASGTTEASLMPACLSLRSPVRWTSWWASSWGQAEEEEGVVASSTNTTGVGTDHRRTTVRPLWETLSTAKALLCWDLQAGLADLPALGLSDLQWPGVKTRPPGLYPLCLTFRCCEPAGSQVRPSEGPLCLRPASQLHEGDQPSACPEGTAHGARLGRSWHTRQVGHLHRWGLSPAWGPRGSAVG